MSYKCLCTFTLLVMTFQPCQVAADTETVSSTASVLLESEDDKATAALLAHFLQDHDYSIKNREGNVFAVKANGLWLVLSTNVFKTGLDQVVVSYMVSRRSTPEARDLIRKALDKLNSEVAGVKFLVSGDDGTVFCQLPVTFVNRLTLIELEAAFLYMQAMQVVLLLRAPELLPHFEG